MIIFSMLYRTMQDGQLVVMPLGQADRMIALAPTLAAYGCNAMLWPPLTMSQSGAADNADGYGVKFHLHTGQWPGQPLRWGTAKQIQIANLLFHDKGMKVLEDAVIHQMDGGYPKQTYIELGSDGKPDPALFQKTPDCFYPNVPADAVFDSEGNYAFGDLVSFLHCIPAGYMEDGIIRAMKWRKKRFGLDGFRLDDTKGENIAVSAAIINQVGGWTFGECFTGDPNELEEWVLQSGGKRTLDFTLHWALQSACDGGSLRGLQGAGLAARDAGHSVLFVDTADTDQNNSENIKFNKLFAYLYILTVPAAAALIYSGDYELYGLGKYINQMMWVASTFAFGKVAWEYVTDTVIVWSRDGDGGEYGWSGGLMCGFSSDPINPQSFWARTPLGANKHLHDYLGHGPDVWTNQDGWAHFTIGPNVNGTAQNGVAYAEYGVNRAIPITPIKETQTGSLTDFSDF